MSPQSEPFFVLTEKLSLPTVQRGHQHFFLYNLNGSAHGNKAGFYVPPVIYLDFFEILLIKGKQTFPLEEYCIKTEIYPEKTVHYYEIPPRKEKITLTIFLYDTLPLLHIMLTNKKSQQFLFRMRFPFNYVFHEHATPYVETTIKEHTAIIKSTFEKHLMAIVKFEQPFQHQQKGQIHEFKVKANTVSCFLYGTNEIFRLSNVLMNYAKKRRKKEEKEKQKKINHYLHTMSSFEVSHEEKITKTFCLAKWNIRLLRHYQPGLGEGFFAGLPQYPEYFGRDTFWSLPGILMTGDFENAKYALNVFTRYQSKWNTETKKIGEIPHEIWLNGESDYYSADATILYLYAVDYYYQWTADKMFLERNYDALKKAFTWIKHHLKQGLITNKPEGFLKGTTWMDSYNRAIAAIEMQALTIKALQGFMRISKKLKQKDSYTESKQLLKQTKQKLKHFWLEKYYADRIKHTGNLDPVFTANQFVPLMFGYASENQAKKIFQLAREKGLFCDHGVRTRAKRTRGYNPGHYHKGMIWPLITGWATLAALRYHLFDEAKFFIKAFTHYPLDYVPGMFPEALHGNRLSIKLSGEKFQKEKVHFTDYLQLWSAALFIQVIVEGVFGIKPLPNKKKVKITPKILWPSMKLENLRIFDGMLSLEIQKGKPLITKKEGSFSVELSEH